MEKDMILHGVHIGEHSFEEDAIMEELRVRCVEPGFNFATIRPPSRRAVAQESYIKWAKYLAENKIYFVFLYNVQHPPVGEKSHITKETMQKMREIAGEYFVGDMIGETGSSFASKWPGYYKSGVTYGDRITLDTNLPDMETAHNKYVEFVSEYIKTERELGAPKIVSVEATALNRYNAEAGVELPMLELMCGHPEILVSSLRGTARATAAPLWGTYIAHEWYGGMRHTDMLKRKRLELGYKYAYMAGSQAFCLESGDESVSAYGYADFGPESDVCKDYQNVMAYLRDYIKSDARPKGGPKVKVAFLQGNHDSWGSWGGSTTWNQFGREEWGHNEAEHSWRLLEEIGTKRPWNDISNFGDEDLSALPAFGQYDVIPTEAPLETYKNYDYLIFVGWNSMTDEIYDKLIAFVENGGKLLATAAHINYSTRRDGEKILPSKERLEKLFGFVTNGESFRTNAGVKFTSTSLTGNLYPGSCNLTCDPILSEGYLSYLKADVTTGTVVAELSESFDSGNAPGVAVIENKLGAGVATLVMSENYPGNGALSPLYRVLVREMLTQSARDCEVKVKSSGALRYSVYEGGKMYLLNTDYDMKIIVEVSANGKTEEYILAPLELRAINY